jgi:peptidoglycan hydrolase-like protein with peptidoglycan-binding domain
MLTAPSAKKTREMLYSEDAKADFFERGEVSEKLKSYQTKLKNLGYLTTNVDGTYGEDTEAAVKRFQERNGLIGDGYLGPQTIELLMSSEAQANALMMGMKGSDVQNVQQRLKELNYLKTVDGYFGSGTENAVRAFQDRNGLSVDGKVGKNTMSVLMSSKAKKASSSGSSTSSGSSSSGSSSSGSSSLAAVRKLQFRLQQRAIKGGASVETFLSIAKSKLAANTARRQGPQHVRLLRVRVLVSESGRRITELHDLFVLAEDDEIPADFQNERPAGGRRDQLQGACGHLSGRRKVDRRFVQRRESSYYRERHSFLVVLDQSLCLRVSHLLAWQDKPERLLRRKAVRENEQPSVLLWLLPVERAKRTKR